MKRLFTFGCSFTNYRWSTWADCLAPEFDYFENWGQAGGGNCYIFNSLMEADQRHNFTQGDTIVVCWTGVNRDDRYVDQRWHTLGNMFACPIYNPEYLKTHADIRGYLIRDIVLMKAAKVFLESKPDVKWKFLSMIEPKFSSGPHERHTTDDVIELYQDVLDAIQPSFYTALYNEQWPNRPDNHPTPVEHLAYLDKVLPGWVTKHETRVKMHEESINLVKDPKKSGMAQVTRL